jgi:PBP1b-binding outer membrane lipoprotein LpoB
MVALASVNTDDSNYAIQTTTLQKAIQVIMRRAKKLRFTRAIEANRRDPALPELYQTIEWNYWKGNPIDPEDAQKYSRLANVDCLLFGRVSSLTRRGRDLTEVSYRFTWELVDCQTGEVIWDHLYKIRKNIR